MPLRRRALVGVGLLPLAAPGRARAQEAEPWRAVLAESLAAFDELSVALVKDPSLRSSLVWQLGLIGALDSCLRACQDSGSDELLALARSLTRDYLNGVMRSDRLSIARAIFARGRLHVLTAY